MMTMKCNKGESIFKCCCPECMIYSKIERGYLAIYEPFIIEDKDGD